MLAGCSKAKSGGRCLFLTGGPVLRKAWLPLKKVRHTAQLDEEAFSMLVLSLPVSFILSSSCFFFLCPPPLSLFLSLTCTPFHLEAACSARLGCPPKNVHHRAALSFYNLVSLILSFSCFLSSILPESLSLSLRGLYTNLCLVTVSVRGKPGLQHNRTS